MDPNETLRELRELLQGHRYGEAFEADDADRIRDLFQALDKWLIRGGFLPNAWRTGPGAVHVRQYGGEVTSVPDLRIAILFDEEYETRGSYAYDTEDHELTRAAEDHELTKLRSGEWAAYGIVLYAPCTDHHGFESCTHTDEIESVWGTVADAGHDGDYATPADIRAPSLRQAAQEMWDRGKS